MLNQATRRLAIRVLPLGLALAIAMPGYAAPDAQLPSALASFSKGQTGDSSAIEQAATSFLALAQAEPANPLLLAYAGTATSMLASTTVLPWKKIRYAEDGLAMIDKALVMLTAAHNVPVQQGTVSALEVHLLAANTFMAVPAFMNRSARGAKLLEEVLSSPLLAQSSTQFQQAVRQRAARQKTATP